MTRFNRFSHESSRGCSQAYSQAYSRRQFLTTSGAALGGLVIGAKTLSAKSLGVRNANAFLDTSSRSAELQSLAAVALDAARHAGASYADVRMGVRHLLTVALTPIGVPMATLGSTTTFGIRTVVDGAVAFEYGTVMTTDAVTMAAQLAVTRARGFASLSIASVELANTPVVTGTWRTPYEIDPFTVPILEQGDLISALGAAGGHTEGVSGRTNFHWERETRVCATSDGSHVTQLFQRAQPGYSFTGNWIGALTYVVPEIRSRHGGYETVTLPTLPESIKETSTLVKRYATLPVKAMDVGRYPMVLVGDATAFLLANTLGPALHMDRLLGLEAGAAGTSFLARPNKFSPALSVVAGRPLGELCGVTWDDECVASTNLPVITQGELANVLTDRQTAPQLASLDQTRALSSAPHGWATSMDASRLPMIGGGHLTMAPARKQTTVDDLCRAIPHGVLVTQIRRVSTDQQLSSGLINGNDSVLLELKNGAVTGLIRGAAIQFKTAKLWGDLTSIGDERTTRSISTELSNGYPRQIFAASATAPAVACGSVDLFSMQGR